MEYSEYRSAIFTNTPEQLETAKRVTKEVQVKRFTPKVRSLSLSGRCFPSGKLVVGF
jgi:peptide methionine sulfoxide reductase MsrA